MTRRRPFQITEVRKFRPSLRISLRSVAVPAFLMPAVRRMSRVATGIRAALRPVVRSETIDHRLDEGMRVWKARSMKILNLKLTGLENEK